MWHKELLSVLNDEFQISISILFFYNLPLGVSSLYFYFSSILLFSFVTFPTLLHPSYVLLFSLLTNSILQSPSSESQTPSASWGFPRIWQKLKFHHRVHNSLPLLDILSQINPIHAIPICLRHAFLLFSHPRLSLPVVLQVSLDWTCRHFPFFLHACHMARPSRSPWFDHPNYI